MFRQGKGQYLYHKKPKSEQCQAEKSGEDLRQIEILIDSQILSPNVKRNV